MRYAAGVILGLVLLMGLAVMYIAPALGNVPSAAETRKVDARTGIVVSSSISADLARRVVLDKAKVTCLATAGVDPHYYEPTPSDARAIANADVLIMVGAGFDDWMVKLAQSTRSKATIIKLGDFASLHNSCQAHAHDEDHHGHDHGDLDPHFWQDPSRVSEVVLKLAESLGQISPDNAAVYQANASGFSKELITLDNWIKTQTDTIPQARRKLFTRHDAMGYYAKRYGFEVLPTLQGLNSGETSEPSAKRVSQIIAEIKASGVPAIFADTQTPDRLINRIARDANVKVVSGLYTDALGTQGSNGATYMQMMQTNTRLIVDALK